MVVSRLMKVRFPSLIGDAELLFQLLSRHAAFEDTMELLRVDV